jgi:type IV pilus assembly protein PilW
MKPCHKKLQRAPRQSGYTLIEILVALFIGVFLLAGLFTILQNTRRTSSNQTGLAQLQDEERMAMTILDNVIQNAGYFDPGTTSANVALPASTSAYATGSMAAAQALSGSDSTTATIIARYTTNGTDNVLSCTGTTGTAGTMFINTFYIYSNMLYCSRDGTSGSTGTGIPLVTGVTNMQIYYGVSTVTGSNNVDTYLTASQVTASTGGWASVSSVRVTLGFVNPLSGQAGYAATPTVYLTRVIPIQGRTGVIATAL